MSSRLATEQAEERVTGEVTAVPPPLEGAGRAAPLVSAEAEGRPPGRLARAKRMVPTDLDLRNTWPIIAGAILLPLGLAGILLGWHGAAHGRVDQQQIPYLISGGVLGLAGVIVGCFFYWSHWLYRIYDQADLHHAEAMRVQAELTRALIEALGHQPAAGQVAEVPSRNGTAAPAFVVTPTGTNFHLPSCPIIANRLPTVRPVAAEETARLRPCRICEPLVSQ